MREFPVQVVQDDVAALTRIAVREEAHMVVFMDDEASKYRGRMMTCAGPLLSSSLPPTLYVRTDRRYAHWIQALASVHPNVLVVGGDPVRWDALPDGVSR